MFKVFIIGNTTEKANKILTELLERGVTCSITPADKNVNEQITESNPDLILLAVDNLSDAPILLDIADSIKKKKPIAAIALLSRETLDIINPTTNIDDFILEPWDAAEAIIRAKRILRRTTLVDDSELIRCGDLVIDKATCEVSISGKLIELTFKEYELLIFLASNRGRVFTRDALLDRVWGYDYFGGDRTVDVHIRRLRSKIEDPNHTFVETIRNIGYKFKKEL